MTGKAQQAYTALPLDESQTYNKVKVAILLRYGVNEEAYQSRFQAANRKDSETNQELAVRLLDLQDKWLKKHYSGCHQGAGGLGAVPQHPRFGEASLGKR